MGMAAAGRGNACRQRRLDSRFARNKEKAPSIPARAVGLKGEGAMADQSAEEQKKTNIAAMGEELGTLYSALCQKLAIGYVYWPEYVDLFGTKSSRIDMLNQAAPMFFRMIQDELWGDDALEPRTHD